MKKLLIPMFALGAAFVVQPAVAEGSDLYKTKGCVACHAVENKIVGPAYKEVAEKYADDENAVETLANHIKNGSSGAWGPIPMPPNNVTEEEAEELAKWVLSQ